MTTRLLAEVARRQQTTDFDDESIDAMLESAAEPTGTTGTTGTTGAIGTTGTTDDAAPEQIQKQESSHPHTLRRRMPSGTGR